MFIMVGLENFLYPHTNNPDIHLCVSVKVLTMYSQRIHNLHTGLYT